MTITIHANGTCLIEDKEVPAVGLGTYRLQQDICFNAVSKALELGYRIIDTATFYDNFEPIAKALKAYPRKEIYLISKVWPDSHRPDDLRNDLSQTLERLQTEYLDTYFLHWPNSSIPIEETLHAMETARNQGLIRHIGMSNVTVNHLKRALEVNVPISWVQNEMHPNFYEPNLIEFCKKHSIVLQAWRPLNFGELNKDTLLAKIGKNHGKTAAQVSLRWIIQHGCLPLPASRSPKHLEENLKMTDFILSQDEMAQINQRAKHGTRFRLGADRNMGFTDEFDFSYEECWPKR